MILSSFNGKSKGEQIECYQSGCCLSKLRQHKLLGSLKQRCCFLRLFALLIFKVVGLHHMLYIFSLNPRRNQNRPHKSRESFDISFDCLFFKGLSFVVKFFSFRQSYFNLDLVFVIEIDLCGNNGITFFFNHSLKLLNFAFI